MHSHAHTPLNHFFIRNYGIKIMVVCTPPDCSNELQIKSINQSLISPNALIDRFDESCEELEKVPTNASVTKIKNTAAN